jgi:L-aspartate oxidase
LEIGAPAATLRATPIAEIDEGDMPRLRALMMDSVGVVRDGRSLKNAVATIRAMTENSGPSLPIVAAGLIAEAALARPQSVGGHFRSDDRAAVRAA